MCDIDIKTSGNTSLLYHGSGDIVEHPKILTIGPPKDFSWGFYCTRIEKQARRWALNSKFKRHIINVYEFTPNPALDYKLFENVYPNDYWLDFVALCRSCTNRRRIPHRYDIIEGPLADDKIWETLYDFISGKLPRSYFWGLAKFDYVTNQVTFHTERALSCLKFKEYYEL